MSAQCTATVEDMSCACAPAALGPFHGGGDDCASSAAPESEASDIFCVDCDDPIVMGPPMMGVMAYPATG
eukprot:2972039-Pyramimonas_sp.AAC.1